MPGRPRAGRAVRHHSTGPPPASHRGRASTRHVAHQAVQRGVAGHVAVQADWDHGQGVDGAAAGGRNVRRGVVDGAHQRGVGIQTAELGACFGVVGCVSAVVAVLCTGAGAAAVCVVLCSAVGVGVGRDGLLLLPQNMLHNTPTA